ncbi:MAG: sulfur oxidation c-type cytochrome SoxA [Alphaproteobacteria bacterium]|jgi:L-cysteine S-thiosulfotransferase|nr:sulfur oxidation c-type cytochrome SoxA [Alphaproteobacteria bacterium]MBT4711050.1 sulfur oxidation c-type cytochrome SoxA [Alphaproteobacteria bacterium]MBT5860840.1 sulfur oxidation c-type cytochrome SoxA [Alphaproteobacteria bacterium]
MNRSLWIFVAAFGGFAAYAFLAAGIAHAQAPDLSRFSVEDRKSGYVFLGEQVRALQDDDFQNPGMFAVDRGQRIWNTVDGEAGKSCATCHGDAAESMAGVSARYPQFDADRGAIINLELRINEQRMTHMMAPPLEYESEDLLALTTYIAGLSRGMPLEVNIEGDAAPFFEKGKDFFFERRGQLDLACNQCHDDLDGMMLRGDKMSQGQINGFPFYRLIWNSVGSTHRMFEWCNTSMRAEPFAYGSEEYLNLELYVAWRGRGLLVETPAVRR